MIGNGYACKITITGRPSTSWIGRTEIRCQRVQRSDCSEADKLAVEILTLQPTKMLYLCVGKTGTHLGTL